MVWLKRVIAGVAGAVLPVVLVVIAIITIDWNASRGSSGVGVFVMSLSTLLFMVAAWLRLRSAGGGRSEVRGTRGMDRSQ